MKRLFLLFVLTACGGTTTTGTDAGVDSGNDSATINDASTDSATSGGDGGLGAGEFCDPQNNQCRSGLLCCSEPTHMADAMTAYFCEKPVNNGCPLLP